MNNEQIEFLKELLNDGMYAQTKDTPDSIDFLIQILEVYSILERKGYLLKTRNRMALKKLLELNSIDDFESWLVKKQNPSSITYNVNNNINTNDSTTNIGIGENITQTLNIEANKIQDTLKELSELGVPQEDVNKVKYLITNEKDKAKLTEKLLTWVGKMSSKAIEKGIELNIPVVIEKIQGLL